MYQHTFYCVVIHSIEAYKALCNPVNTKCEKEYWTFGSASQKFCRSKPDVTSPKPVLMQCTKKIMCMTHFIPRDIWTGGCSSPVGLNQIKSGPADKQTGRPTDRQTGRPADFAVTDAIHLSIKLT
jgi:hypothetical protein